jgi:spermidine/putrescine ABC transporter ATP-binding subunit
VRGASLRLDTIRKTFGPVTAVDDLSLEVEGGIFLTLLGASGSGKSTTLMLIAGFLTPDSGAILVDEEPITFRPAYKRNFGVVFQNYALFPHMRVVENVGFPLKMRGLSQEAIRRKVESTLELVKLAGHEARYPRQLSGGQQQRVALARAIVADQPVLLMDEPLSALDKQLREHMQLELKNIQRQLGVTVIYVTHDQTEALVMSDRIAVMRGGHIEQVGSPRDVYDRPANRYVAEFVGESNFLNGTVREVTAGDCQVDCAGLLIVGTCPPGARSGQAVSVAVRPERLRLQPGGSRANQVAAVIEEAIYIGDAIKYRVRTAGGALLTAKSGRGGSGDDLKPGQPVTVGWSREDVMFVAGGR